MALAALPMTDRQALMDTEAALGENDNAKIHSLLETHPNLAAASFSTISPEYNGSTLLHLAASRGDCELGAIVIAALDRTGQNIDSLCDRDDNRPQHWAALAGKLDFLKLLKAHEANLLVENRLGTNALQDGVRYGRIDILDYLITEYGTDAIKHENHYGYNALNLAAHYFQPEILSYLLGRQKETAEELMNKPNSRKYTPLDLLEKHWLKFKEGKRGIKGLSSEPDKYQRLIENHERAKAILEESGAVHGELWNSQSDKERLAYSSTNSKPWRDYQRENHSHPGTRSRFL